MSLLLIGLSLPVVAFCRKHWKMLSDQQKKRLSYAAVTTLMVLGVALLFRWTELGALFFRLGLVLLLIIGYLDSRGEFYPDTSWKMDEHGMMYRMTGAGSNRRLTYNPLSVLEKHLERLEKE
jgi:hypothetical protein